MISVTLSPNHYKSREREGSKEDERETEPVELPKLPNNEKSDWQDAESETGPGEQLKRWNKDKHVYNEDVKDWLLSQLKREKPGYSN